MGGSLKSSAIALPLAFVLAAACTGPTTKEGKDATTHALSEADSLVRTAKTLYEQGFSDSVASVVQALHETDSFAFSERLERAVWEQWHAHLVVDLADVVLGTGPARARSMSRTIAHYGAEHDYHDARTLAAHDLIESRAADRLGDKTGSYSLSRAAFDRLEDAGDTMNIIAARALSLISKAVLDSGDVDRALPLLFRAARLAEAIDSIGDACGFLNRRASQLQSQDMKLALALYDSSQNVAIRGADTIALCTVLNGRSVAYQNAFDGGRAIEERLKALGLLSRLKNYPGDLLPYLCTNLAQVAYERGQFTLGDSVLGVAQGLEANGLASVGSIAFIKLTRGMREGSIGNNVEFLAAAREALEFAEKARMSSSSPTNYLHIVKSLTAALYLNRQYSECVDIVRSMLDRPEFNTGGMAPARQWLLEHEAIALVALDSTALARSILTGLTSTSNRWHALGNLADCFQAMQDWDAADSCRHLQWIEMPEGDHDARIYRYQLRIHFSRTALSRGDWRDAVSFADEALVIIDSAEMALFFGKPGHRYDRRGAWEAKALALFEIAKRKGPTDSSFHECLRTDSMLRAACDKDLIPLRDPNNRSVLLEISKASATRSIHLLKMLLEGGATEVQSERLLNWIDQVHDHSFKARNATEVAALTWGLPQVLVKSEYDLRGILTKQAEIAHGTVDPSHRAHLDREILLLSDSLRRVQASISARAPAFYAEYGSPPQVSLAKLRMTLDKPSSALLVQHFDNIDSTLVCIVVCQDTVLYYTVRFDPALAESISSLSHSGTALEQDYAATRSAGFGLVEPVARIGSIEDLLIVPDQLLEGVPFELLAMREGHDVITTRYATSISRIGLAQVQNAPVNSGYVGFAPEYKPLAISDPAFERGSPKSLPHLRPLSANADEVASTSSWFTGSVFIGIEATEENFSQTAPDAAVIHLAMHSIADREAPMNSMLVFNDTEQRNGTYDGLVHFHELIDMSLHCDLAVLSACETGVGQYRVGEGVMSLARAFNYAGVRNVVSSLWKVDDLATKEIMVKFYEKLAEGMGKADALAEAKRWYRREHPDAPPSKWAAFILIGDNEPVKLKKRSPVRPWMWGGATVVLIAGFAIRRKRGSKLAA